MNKDEILAILNEHIPGMFQKLADAQKGDGNGGNGGGEGGDKKPGNQFSEEEVRRLAEEEAKKRGHEESLKGAIGFNLGLDAFLEKNKAFLPEKLTDMIKIAKDKTFSSETERARSMQKIILDEVLAKQEVIDLLPESLKSKVNLYKTYAEDEKQKRAFEFYDLVETIVLLKRGQSENGFNKQGKNAQNTEYNDKFLALGEKYTKKGV